MNNDNAIIYMKIEKKESLPNLEKNLAERDLSKIRIAYYQAVHAWRRLSLDFHHMVIYRQIPGGPWSDFLQAELIFHAPIFFSGWIFERCIWILILKMYGNFFARCGMVPDLMDFLQQADLIFDALKFNC